MIKRKERIQLLDKIKALLELQIDSEDNVEEIILSKLQETLQKNKDLELQVETLSSVIAELKAKVEESEKELEQLKVENQKLKVYETEIEGYKAYLKEKIINYGIKAQGNMFPVETFKKFVETLSVDELKKVAEDFEKQFKAKFAGARVTDPKVEKNEEYVPDPEVEPQEFNKFIAEKALEYAKVSGLSIKEATIEMYKKYLKINDEE